MLSCAAAAAVPQSQSWYFCIFFRAATSMMPGGTAVAASYLLVFHVRTAFFCGPSFCTPYTTPSCVPGIILVHQGTYKMFLVLASSYGHRPFGFALYIQLLLQSTPGGRYVLRILYVHTRSHA